jgi:serine O-acetyltransferase
MLTISPVNTVKLCREVIRADLYRYFGKNDTKTFIRVYLRVPGFRYSFHLRHAAKLYHKGDIFSRIRLLYHRVILGRLDTLYGICLPPTTHIGAGIFFSHFGNVIINGDATIGTNVAIGNGVMIGRTFRGRNPGVPTIGDGVWIGSHAILVGNIRVGNNVLIAPGAYVNFDVPDQAVVLGNPGKIISYDGTDGYVNHIYKSGQCV